MGRGEPRIANLIPRHSESLTDAEIYPIEAPELDLIDELLQANCTSVSLQEYREDTEQSTGS